MSNTQIYILFAFFVVIQIAGLRRRWMLPLLRGEDWFLALKVGSGFYKGPGRELLRRYRLWLFVPFGVELAGVLAILRFGVPFQLVYLILGLAVLSNVTGSIAVSRARRAAKPFELPGSNLPPSAVTFSLRTRRLGNYTNFRFEAALACLNLASLAWLAQYYSAAPKWQSAREVFGLPILLVYLQTGLVLAKRAMVAWRTVVPREQAEGHMERREATRQFWIDVFDSVRVILAVDMALAAIRRGMSNSWDDGGAPGLLFYGTLATLAIWVFWYSRRRNALVAVVTRLKPIVLPNDLESATHSSRWVCYRPSHPVLLVKGPRGYALNLASGRTQVGALYFVGLLTVFVWLR